MTDTEFAAWLRERRGAVTHEDCVRIEQQAARRIRKNDIESGPWVGNQIVHHGYGESSR